MTAAVDLQTAVFNALDSALSVPVYDDVPQFETWEDLAFPFVVIGEDELELWDDDRKNGWDATVTIHVWSRARGRLETKQLQEAIYNALHRQNIAIGSYGTLGFTCEYQDTDLDADGLTRHGVMRFQTYFGQPHVPVPTSPSGFNAPVISSSSVTLIWDEPSGIPPDDEVDGWIIERCENSSNYIELVDITDNAQTSYIDSTVESGKTYCYRISAYNRWGKSDVSRLGPIDIPPSPLPENDIIWLNLNHIDTFADRPPSYRYEYAGVGTSLDMSENGSLLVAGASRNNDNFWGGVCFLTLSNNTFSSPHWVVQESFNPWSSGGPNLGQSVNLSSDGTTSVASAPQHNNPDATQETGNVINFYMKPDGTGLNAPVDPDGLIDPAFYQRIFPVGEGGFTNPKWFGWPTGMSKNGQWFAACYEPAHDAPPKRITRVAVYYRDSELSTFALHTTIPDLADAPAPAEEQFGGYAIAFDDDGNRLFIAGGGTANHEGKLWIYRRDADTWILEDSFVSPNSEANGFFGWSMDVSSNGLILAISAPRETVNAVERTGRVYIYTYDGGWSLHRTLEITPANGNPCNYFGRSVSMNSDGTIIAIGAPGYFQLEPGKYSSDWDKRSDHSFAFVWTFNADMDQWEIAEELYNGDYPDNSYFANAFGYTVCLSGDGLTMAICNAVGNDNGGTVLSFSLNWSLS